MLTINHLLSRKSILFIAPDNEYLSQLTFMVKKEGYAHFFATDMARAKQIIQQEKPDIVFVSWEFRREVENLRGICEQPYSSLVIIAEEHIGSKEVFETLENGADDFLRRPLDAYQMKGKVHLAFRLTNAMRCVESFELNNQHKAELLSGIGLSVADLNTGVMNIEVLE
ncbi:MAG: hypothetical protein ACPGJS_02085 [Flammeovirgaceae bacterium]